MSFFEISFSQIPPNLDTFFNPDEPQAKRCFAVLDGVAAGRVFINHHDKPSWGIVQEAYDGSIFLGGQLTRKTVAEVVSHLRKDGAVLAGLRFEDPKLDLLPEDPDYAGLALEFYERPSMHKLDHIISKLPQELSLQKVDRELVLKSTWGPGDVEAIGGLAEWERHFLGFCVVRDGKILAEAFAGPPARGVYEPGVFTQETHRSQGYGSIVSARLIQEIESFGGTSYWNCAKQNLASARIAEKLGYQRMTEYRVLGWRQL